MKWTDKDIERCISLIKEFNDIKKASKIINRSVKSIVLKLNRLGIKISELYIKLPDKKCLNCNKILERGSDFKIRKFCNRSCSVTYFNIGSTKSLETRNKIGKSSLGRKFSDESIIKITGERHHNWKGGNLTKKILGKSKCSRCGIYNINIKYKRICADCRFKYYKFYRPLCEFEFDVNNYKEYFNLYIVKKYGWYSPKNKGNNLKGVSKDHLYSVKDGFKNKISPLIIKHPANCEIITHTQNQIKNSKSKITINELIERIEKFNKKYK